MPDWVPVSSSMIEAVSYDQTKQELGIRFVDGREYTYVGVPVDVVQGLTHSSSPGRYFWQYIRGAYDTRED